VALTGVTGFYNEYRRARSMAAAAPAVGKLATLKKVLHQDYLATANAFFLHAAGHEPVANGSALSKDASRIPAGKKRSERESPVHLRSANLSAPLLQRQDRMSMAAGPRSTRAVPRSSSC
jgi:hypothetical protein